MLIKAKQSWIVPAVAILGLIGYHNERKDKDFLLLQTKDAIALFRVEYLLIGFPFILIECLRSRFPEAGAMIVTSLLLPKLKAIKWKSIAFPLPFLYKGGLEYSRIHNRLLPNNLQAISQEYGRSFKLYILKGEDLTLLLFLNSCCQYWQTLLYFGAICD